MSDLTFTPRIVGIVPDGTFCHVIDQTDPLYGKNVIVVRKNGATGGIAGGGAVWVQLPGMTEEVAVTRYMRVQPISYPLS